MSIKLMAFDLDGTLLNSHKEIGERTLAVIRRALVKGVYVTIATGRPLFSAKHFGSIIGANVPLIACNGAIVQGQGDSPIFARYHTKETLTELLTLLYERQWYVNWYVEDKTYAYHYDRRYFATYTTTRGFRVEEVGGNFLDYIYNVPQCVMRDLEGNIATKVKAVEEIFQGRLSAQQNTGYSVDITPPHINKAVGIKSLAEHLGLKASEVMVCGDAGNDLEMLAMGAFAVVPANGTDEAKSLADYITATNDDEGIADAIEKYVL